MRLVRYLRHQPTSPLMPPRKPAHQRRYRDTTEISADRPYPETLRVRFEAYAALTRTLRTWLVGYGVGAPVIVASQENLAAAVRSSPWGGAMIFCFLGGVSLQLFDLLLQKIIAWLNYDDTFPARPKRRLHRWGQWRLKSMVATFLPDFLTIILFVLGTILLLQAAM